MNTVSSHLLTYPDCCDLAKPEKALQYIANAPVVDSLSDYTAQMWDILTDVVTWEWFQIHIPRSTVPWGGPVHLPSGMRMLHFLDRTHARKLQNDVQHNYLAQVHLPDRMSVFGGYGLRVPDDCRRELEGMEFLARQATYLKSRDNYILIVQDL